MRYAIGVDLGGTNIKAGLVSERGEISHEMEITTDARSGGHGVGRQIAEVAARIFQAAPVREAVVGVGIGSPGVILAESGVIDFSPNLYTEDGKQWRNVPLAEHVRDALSPELRDRPIVLENDVNAMAFGEYTFGAGQPVRYMIGLTLGTGVGGGIVFNGEVYRGPSNSAGEIGHMTVDPNGPRCGCGNYGCLEALVGTAGILDRTRRKVLVEGRPSLLEGELEELTPLRIEQAAHQGDAVAREVYLETGRYPRHPLGLAGKLPEPRDDRHRRWHLQGR
ncbi:MAG: glucokinase [Candidatus Poribacteria bacterium]|nr:MAG: glucokinase [Candidatus Poribacteria bacterium]